MTLGNLLKSQCLSYLICRDNSRAYLIVFWWIWNVLRIKGLGKIPSTYWVLKVKCCSYCYLNQFITFNHCSLLMCDIFNSQCLTLLFHKSWEMGYKRTLFCNFIYIFSLFVPWWPKDQQATWQMLIQPKFSTSLGFSRKNTILKL